MNRLHQVVTCPYMTFEDVTMYQIERFSDTLISTYVPKFVDFLTIVVACREFTCSFKSAIPRFFLNYYFV